MLKTKTYKTFAFPNKLTPLETYYYYLLEFNVIPKYIPTNTIGEIFTHVANDYLDALLTTAIFSNVASNFMRREDPEGTRMPGLSKLLSYCSELDDAHEEEIVAIKKLLKLYVTNQAEFVKVYQSGKMDKVFTE